MSHTYNCATWKGYFNNAIIYQMKVPYRNKAVVTKEKIVDYLLNINNPDGKPKAIYFRGKGFNETNIDTFEKRLLKIIHTQEVEREETSLYGKKYIIKGEILTPNGYTITIRTVWILLKNTRKPSLVSAYRV